MQKQDVNVKKMLHTILYFYRVAIHYRPTFILVILLTVIFNAITPFVNIIMPKLIIDELLGAKEINRLIGYVCLLAVGNSFFFIMNKILGEMLNTYGDSYERLFAMNISEKAMTMDFEHTEDPNMLDQCEKAKTGMSWYSGGILGLTNCFIQIIASFLTLGGVTVLIVTDAPILLLFIIISVIVSTIFNARINAINVKYFNKLVGLNRAFEYLYIKLPGFLFGKDLRLFGADKMVLEKGETMNEETTKQWRDQANESLKYTQGELVVSGIRDLINYTYLGVLAIRKIISIGEFTMLSNSAGTFSNSLRNIIWNVQELIKKSVFMKEYVSFMENKDTLVKGNRQTSIDDINEFCIEFKNVSFVYPRTNEKILNHVNLVIESGEHLAIVGLNGAGKTTFIKLLCRLYDVTEGEILINGVNIKEYAYEEYLKLFSVVFQDFKLFAFSIKENIVLEEQPESDETIKELCKLYGLEEKVNNLEKGIHTSVNKQFDEEGIELSGGEAQKLAIIRAIYKKAPIVIMDEPTAALDPLAEYEIYKHFDHLVGGKTAVYISHRLSSCRFCDKIAVFSEGTVKEYGTHDELISLEDGIYSKMYSAQAQYYKLG